MDKIHERTDIQVQVKQLTDHEFEERNFTSDFDNFEKFQVKIKHIKDTKGVKGSLIFCIMLTSEMIKISYILCSMKIIDDSI